MGPVEVAFTGTGELGDLTPAIVDSGVVESGPSSTSSAIAVTPRPQMPSTGAAIGGAAAVALLLVLGGMAFIRRSRTIQG